MLRIRPVWASLSCTMLMAIPGSTISNDIGNTPTSWQYVLADAPLAQSFFTGATGYTLTAVSVVLTSDPNSVPVARPRKQDGIGLQQVTVQLWSDNGLAPPNNAPGALLATSGTILYGTSLTTTPTAYSFPLSYQVQANTRYWIEVVSPNSDSTAAWWGSSTATGTDIATEYYIVGTNPAESTQDPFAFLIGVYGTVLPVTPAPSSLWLAVIGLAGACAWLNRRRFAGGPNPA